MTLSEVIRCIEMVAMQQPSINMIVRNDVFRINSSPNLQYGVFAWTQGQHSGNVVTGVKTYQFTLFYIDRLTENQSNQIEIQSVGDETIGNLLRTLEEFNIFIDSYTIQPFNQRFTDECAGVFCNVTIQVPGTTLCAEAFSDFNQDFNEDFLVF